MRIIFTITLALLTSSLPAFGQEYEIFWVPKFDSLLRAGITSNTRDIIELKDGPLREMRVIERYSRTDTGMIVTVVTMVYKKSKGAVDTTSRSMYTYTNTLKIRSAQYNQFQDGKYMPGRYASYVYDDKDRILLEEVYNNDTLSQKKTYEYGDSNIVTFCSYDDGKNLSYKDRSYNDDKGNLLYMVVLYRKPNYSAINRFVSQFSNEGKRFSYKYDEEARLIEKREYKGDTLMQIVEDQYSTFGRVTVTATGNIDTSDHGLTGNSREYVRYDEFGNSVEESSCYQNELQSLTLSKYDSLNRLVERIRYSDLSFHLRSVHWSANRYEYNSKGNLIKEGYDDGYGFTGQTYSYNRRGDLVEINFYHKGKKDTIEKYSYTYAK